MKLGIMQPYFFPYLGYYSLIKHTDQFILFDTPQYIRHGWINRNKILKNPEGFVYITVPLQKHSRNTRIKDMMIKNSVDWKTKICAQLSIYSNKAPYYSSVISVIEKIFSKEYENITILNKNTISEVCQYLGIDADIKIFSEMDLHIEPPNAPDEWALNICKSLPEVNEYWNPPGGITFFNREKYANNNLDLKFHQIRLKKYAQVNVNHFESGLSIIDVMMHNSKKQIIDMLDDYTLFTN